MSDEYDWDQAAIGWDDNAAVVDYSERAWETFLQRAAPEVVGWPRCRVLDFGCGTGALTRRLWQTVDEVVALDPSHGMISVLADKLQTLAIRNVKTVCSSLRDAVDGGEPALNQPFDAIVASSVMAFVEEPARELSIMKRRLRPDGLIVTWDWEQASPGEFGFTAEILRDHHAAADLETVYAGPGFTLGPGGPGLETVMGIARRTDAP